MLSIQNINPIYDNTYIISFSQSNEDIIIVSPETRLTLSYNNILNYKQSQSKNAKTGICELLFSDDKQQRSFYISLSTLENNIRVVISEKFPNVTIPSYVYNLCKIQVSGEFIEIVEECIAGGFFVCCSITPIGCITPQNTFEIIYKLTNIQKLLPTTSIINEIYSLLERGIDDKRICEVEEYIYSTKQIHIYESQNEDIDILQNEIDKQIEIIK